MKRIVVLAGWITGCASAPAATDYCAPPHAPAPFTLTVDPILTPDQVQTVVDAAASWERHVPVKFDITIDSCQPTAPFRGILICVTVASLERIRTYQDNAISYTTSDRQIMVDPTDGYLLTRLVAHEMGHAMGLGHAPGRVLMAAWLDDIPPEPTAADVAQWCEKHPGVCQ